MRADDGRLLIAKFPHHHDQWDIALWEKTALDLAERAGIAVPERWTVPFGSGSTLLLDRFDRAVGGTRIPYISALTVMSGRDGDTFDYEDLAVQITEDAAGDDATLEALFRRVALSVALHNTDDHLRNTGFLRTPDGWRLSPVFDVNPNPDLGARRQTTVSSAQAIADEPAGLLRLAEWCHLDPSGCRRVIGEVLDATSTWRQVATENEAPREEIERFATIFDHQERALRLLAVSPTRAGRAPAATSSQPRKPRGTPTGGQFGPNPHAESGVGHQPDRQT